MELYNKPHYLTHHNKRSGKETNSTIMDTAMFMIYV